MHWFILYYSSSCSSMCSSFNQSAQVCTLDLDRYACKALKARATKALKGQSQNGCQEQGRSRAARVPDAYARERRPIAGLDSSSSPRSPPSHANIGRLPSGAKLESIDHSESEGPRGARGFSYLNSTHHARARVMHGFIQSCS